MNTSDFQFLADFLLERSGLALTPQKQYLLDARLIPVAQSIGLNTLEELVAELRKGKNTNLETVVVEAMTTNETSFFRDGAPFEDLQNVILPTLIKARDSQKRLRIWCAAASTGQEPYTIAMVLEESFPSLKEWKVEIIATDISGDALEKAEAGVYSQFEVQRGLPIQRLIRFFEQEGSHWRIKEHLRDNIQFRQHNLLREFGHFGTFDIIFCRNVLIYFSPETKRDVLHRMHERLASDGYLMLGAAETVLGITDRFERDRSCKGGVYQPVSVDGTATPASVSNSSGAAVRV